MPVLSSVSDAGLLWKTARARRVQAYRPGTRANHHSHILLFLAFTIHFQFPDVPAVAHTLLCFGEFLLRGFTAFKSVLNALASVRHFHVVHNYSSAGFDAPSVALWRRALPLTVRATPGGAPPFPLPLLQRICRLACSLGGEGRVFAALLSLTFYSLARISSLLPATGRTFDLTLCPRWQMSGARAPLFSSCLSGPRIASTPSRAFGYLSCLAVAPQLARSPACETYSLSCRVPHPPPPSSPSLLRGGGAHPPRVRLHHPAATRLARLSATSPGAGTERPHLSFPTKGGLHPSLQPRSSGGRPHAARGLA